MKVRKLIIVSILVALGIFIFGITRVLQSKPSETASKVNSVAKESKKDTLDNGQNLQSSTVSQSKPESAPESKPEHIPVSESKTEPKSKIDSTPGASSTPKVEHTPSSKGSANSDPISVKTPANEAGTKSIAQSFKGYIIDEDCFVSYTDPGEDTKTCLNMKSCAASGYGIAVLQSNGCYKFYYFDGTFAPNADGAQAKAVSLVKNTTKKDHVTISVTGILKGDVKTASDGKSYPVITVSSLVEN